MSASRAKDGGSSRVDGERCLAFRHHRDLRLFSRNRKRLDEKYPEITAAFQRQERHSFIADGEIVTFQNGGVKVREAGRSSLSP